MILIIDESVVVKKNEVGLSADEIRGISYICSSHIKGRHLALASRMVLADLSKYEELLEEDRAVFSNIYHKYSFFVAQERFVKVKVRVVADGVVRRDIDALGIVFCIPLADIVGISIGQGINVFLENSDDEEVYCAILERVRLDRGLSGIGLSMNVRGGGGHTTAKEFERSLQRKDAAVCIVDSDMKAPGRSIGDTAKRVMAVVNSGRFVLADALVLNVHEVENLIPPEVYEDGGSAVVHRNVVSELEAYRSSGKLDAHLFFDYKKGLKVCDISPCQYMRKYWGDHVACSSCGGEGKDPCYVIAPYGKQSFVREAIKRRPMPGTRSTELYRVWEEIFDFLFGWCIAAPVIRVL